VLLKGLMCNMLWMMETLAVVSIVYSKLHPSPLSSTLPFHILNTFFVDVTSINLHISVVVNVRVTVSVIGKYQPCDNYGLKIFPHKYACILFFLLSMYNTQLFQVSFNFVIFIVPNVHKLFFF